MNMSEKNMSGKSANPANAINAKGLENGKKPINPEIPGSMDGLDSATILETFDAATILATYPLEHGPRKGETIVMLHGGNMAGWTWDLQVQAMPERHILTPDFPGYGRRTNEAWPGMAGAAADIAELIRTHAIGGKAHVVGLSLGGFVSVELLRHYPQLVRSCTISGSAVSGYARWERALICGQAPLWTTRWYWAAQARAFGIAKEDKELFVLTTSSPSRETNMRLVREAGFGIIPKRPTKTFAYDGPFLAVCAEHDSASIRRAFGPLRACFPQLRTWTAPGMHHAWNGENPELFTQMVATHIDTGEWPESSRQRT